MFILKSVAHVCVYVHVSVRVKHLKSKYLFLIFFENYRFVNLLLEQIDRDAEKKLKHRQIEAEDDVMEEEDTSSDEEEGTEKKIIKNSEEKEDVNIDQTLWGESYTDGARCVETIGENKQSPLKESKPRDIPELSESEKQLLMEEFRSNMFESFLQGNDDNFDYR